MAVDPSRDIALDECFANAAIARTPIVFTRDKPDRSEIIYANPAFLALTGYGAEEVCKFSLERILGNRAAGNRNTVAVLAASDQGLSNIICCRKDGSEFNALLLVAPVNSRNNQAQHHSVSFVDISEKFAPIEETAGHVLDIYADAPGFIALSEGPDHRLTYVNASFNELVGTRELVGRPVSAALPELLRQGFVAMLDSVYESGHPSVGKRTPVRLLRNGAEEEVRYVDFIYQPMRNAAGQITGIFCEGFDVTDAEDAAKNLQRVQAEVAHLSRINSMGTMAATLAHELNQPLAAIENYASGCIHMLESGNGATEKLRVGLSAIASATDRAGKVIKHLRDMTKRAPPVREEFDLTTALEEAVELIKAGGCENVTITSQSCASLFVTGDKIQVQQIMINLLRNACQAAAAAQRDAIVVATSMIRDDYACVVVKDNGCGLLLEAKSDVFSWSESAKPGGMGIGLSICRTIAEAHGGKVTLDWTGPTGTSFSFCMPRARHTQQLGGDTTAPTTPLEITP